MTTFCGYPPSTRAPRCPLKGCQAVWAPILTAGLACWCRSPWRFCYGSAASCGSCWSAVPQAASFPMFIYCNCAARVPGGPSADALSCKHQTEHVGSSTSSPQPKYAPEPCIHAPSPWLCGDQGAAHPSCPDSSVPTSAKSLLWAPSPHLHTKPPASCLALRPHVASRCR